MLRPFRRFDALKGIGVKVCQFHRVTNTISTGNCGKELAVTREDQSAALIPVSPNSALKRMLPFPSLPWRFILSTSGFSHRSLEVDDRVTS